MSAPSTMTLLPSLFQKLDYPPKPNPPIPRNAHPTTATATSAATRRSILLNALLITTPTSTIVTKSAIALELRFGVPDQTLEEAENSIPIHVQSLLKVKDLLMAESLVEAQKALRKSSSYLKQDLYTIIQGKPAKERPRLRKLYADLFNAVTRLDYAARDKDRILIPAPSSLRDGDDVAINLDPPKRTFERYTERTAFERPLTRGVAYAVRVLHSEREQFEKLQGWTIKRMDKVVQTPVHEDEYDPADLEPSPMQEEYVPVIFAQDTVAHVISVDMLSGEEDRENVLRARESGKGVLTAPFRLLKTNRLGVILTFDVYKRDLPPSVTSAERIQAITGYLGGIFDIESLVEKLLHQLTSQLLMHTNAYPYFMTSISAKKDCLCQR